MFLTLADAPSSIISGVSDVLSVTGQAFTFITSNQLCLLFIGASILGIGFRIFRKAKGASSGN